MLTPTATVPSYPPGHRVSVLLPVAVGAGYDYRAGDEGLSDGDVVTVPLGPRVVSGVVWGPGSSDLPVERLRTVLARHDCPPFSPEMRRFIDWVAAYTLGSPGAVLKMALSVPAALDPRAKGKALTFVPPDPHQIGPILSDDQQRAADALIAAQGNGFSVTLVDGVTGSGKTEVYFEAIAAALTKGHQVLVLLPEIALSVQGLDRFAARFGAAPAAWHSGLSDGKRRDTWRAVAKGEARVVVGARSALFLPFADLGLIVVDEEHDGAFKQEDGVHYHARDMAVVRAMLGEFPVILATATPSLETLANVQAGRYRRVHLPDRHAGAVMPEIAIVDLRRFPPKRGHWLSPPLILALTETLAVGEQAMLFLNRRGYAPLTLCRACGFRLQCPHCTAWLVEHRGSRPRLMCHHCGHVSPKPKACPGCGADDAFVSCGPGVERIAEEASALFPEARVEIMASDTVAGVGGAADFVQRVTAREVDVLIGTQIVAKGHHFPWLTLVGVIDADLGLEGGDLRAGERTHQLLAQVAGRAGRAERPGRVMLQTFQPDHPVIRALAANDRDGFIAEEAEQRRAAGMPPFGRLAAVIVSGANADRVDTLCRALARAAPDDPGLSVLGPAPAPMALLRGRHRRRFLVKAPRTVALQTALRDWLARVPADGAVRVQIDVDPYSFF